jgi:hypothetical protein
MCIRDRLRVDQKTKSGKVGFQTHFEIDSGAFGPNLFDCWFGQPENGH